MSFPQLDFDVYFVFANVNLLPLQAIIRKRWGKISLIRNIFRSVLASSYEGPPVHRSVRQLACKWNRRTCQFLPGRPFWLYIDPFRTNFFIARPGLLDRKCLIPCERSQMWERRYWLAIIKSSRLCTKVFIKSFLMIPNIILQILSILFRERLFKDKSQNHVPDHHPCFASDVHFFNIIRSGALLGPKLNLLKNFTRDHA